MKILSLNGVWKYCLNDQKKYRDIQVPSNWYLQGLNHSGKVYYQKKFEISTQKDKEYYLIFKGVDYFCKIKLNIRVKDFGFINKKYYNYMEQFFFLLKERIENKI